MINAIKLKEFDKNELVEAFVDQCLYFRESPTSSLEMSDRIEAKGLKEVHAILSLKIDLCTLASNCCAERPSCYEYADMA